MVCCSEACHMSWCVQLCCSETSQCHRCCNKTCLVYYSQICHVCWSFRLSAQRKRVWLLCCRVSCCACLFSHCCCSSLSCINEYLAKNSGGYLCMHTVWQSLQHCPVLSREVFDLTEVPGSKVLSSPEGRRMHYTGTDLWPFVAARHCVDHPPLHHHSLPRILVLLLDHVHQQPQHDQLVSLNGHWSISLDSSQCIDGHSSV